MLPKTLKVIERGAFSKCPALEEITLPEGVTDIGKNAFRGCKSLKKLHLPASLGQIGENAFKGTGKCEITFEPGSYAEDYMKNYNKVVAKAKPAPRKRSIATRIKNYAKRIIKG